jgi:hypothetical protein
VTIFRTNFTEGNADSGGALYIVVLVVMEQVKINITDCNLVDNKAFSKLNLGSGGHIYLEF